MRCEVTLSNMTGTMQTPDILGGDYAGTWVKQQKSGSTWVELGGGDLAGHWTVARIEDGKPDLAGLDIVLGSAIEDHPLMREIHEARVQELLAESQADAMGLVLGVHGADLDCCDASWYAMGDSILESVQAGLPFATTQTAFMGELADTVAASVADHGTGNTLLTMHMIAPGSLTQAFPYILGWPTLKLNLDYLYNQKTLLAYHQDQEPFNLPNQNQPRQVRQDVRVRGG